MLAGTSIAAPLVSFTAAIIGSVLQDWQPAMIRQRLHMTARWASVEIERETIFGGVLDIPAALRVFDDVVRRPDGSLLHGRWLDTEEVAGVCAENAGPVVTHQLAQVRVELGRRGEGPKLWVTRLDNKAQLLKAARPCRPANEAGPLLLLDSGKSIRVPWREMAALIPAVDPQQRRILPPGAPAAAAAHAVPAPRAVEVVPVQRALAERNLLRTAPDGRLGPETREAIRAFQRQRDEQPSGILNGTQFRALMRR